MEFVEGKCPKCNKELSLPQEFETVLCMYCGASLTPYDLGLKQIDPDFDENYKYAVSQIPDILLKHKTIMDTFKKNLYEDSMNEYIKETKPIFEALEKAYRGSSGNREKIIKDCADAILDSLKEDLDQDKKINSKKKRSLEIESYKVILALFTVPMLGLQKTQSAEALSEILRDRWVEEYPDMVFQKGTFEDINGGFKRNRFCYITTAVCETLDKPDDCYELTMFRQFRDDYMLKQPDGETLVEEYYRLAPEIIRHIDRKKERGDIYREIWKDSLAECLKNIENGQLQACMENYKRMIRKLESEYIP